MADFAVQADLERALGGAQVLAQLADPNRSGTPDPTLIQDYLDSGAAEVRAATEIKHSPETLASLDSASLKRLTDANASLSARIAYERGGIGMAMPQWVKDRADKADHFLDQLATGMRRLGRVAGGTQAAIDQPAAVLDFDPRGHHISIKGFKRGGFR